MSPRAPSRSIFDRVRLRPSQLRTVAERRLADAEYLCHSRQNRYANGAMYLGGFVVECLLKARLLEKHAWLGASGPPERLTGKDRHLWNLCYRWHDLDGLIGVLPEVLAEMRRQRDGAVLLNHLRQICGRWTVFARYSPHSATIAEANTFLAQVQEVKAWLR